MSFGAGGDRYPPSSLNPGTGGNRDPIKPYHDEISYQAQHTADLELEDAEDQEASPLEAHRPLARNPSQLVLRSSALLGSPAGAVAQSRGGMTPGSSPVAIGIPVPAQSLYDPGYRSGSGSPATRIASALWQAFTPLPQ